MSELNVLTTYVIETCCNCGMPFAFTAEFKAERKRKGDTFYCPNGHPQHYVESDEARHKREVEELNRKLANREWELQMATSATISLKRQLTGTKNKLKKVEARVSHGACPCCNRQFKNLQRHMESKHSDYVASTNQPE